MRMSVPFPAQSSIVANAARFVATLLALAFFASAADPSASADSGSPRSAKRFARPQGAVKFQKAKSSSTKGRIDEGLLAARLDTGEFGPAVDQAAGIDDLTERVAYLKQIVAAERDAGEFQA